MNFLLDSTTVTHSLEQSLQKTQSFLAALGTDADFTAKMILAFGNNFDTDITKSLALDWANGDFEKLPSIEIRSSAEINGAKGAFAGANNTIYLSREFVDENPNNIDAIANVILEEIGHSIDWQLNNSDTPGDEGAIFSALVRGETLNSQQRQLLLAEDDSATIALDKQVLQIEQATTYTGDNLGNIITGLDALLDTLQAAINNRVYGNKLPLLGDKLKNSAESGVQFISNFEDDILKKLHEKLDTAVTKTPELIKQALAEALGPSGLKLLPDLNNDGQVDAQEIDQAISFVETTDDVKFNLKLKQEQAANSFSTALDAGIGLPALKLDINGNAQIGLGYDLNLDFGVNNTKGFYFDTSNANELKINFTASLPNLDVTGKLGFLQLNVKDKGTQFNGDFTVDLKDSDNQVLFSELPSVNLANLVDAKLNGSANINLNAATSFQESAVLPSLSTDINIGWGFNSSNADPDNPSSFGDVPSIAFNNVQMDMGTFFSDFAKPILGKIKQVTDPIQPVIKVLEEPLPGFSDVRAIKAALDKDKDGNVTLLDIIETIGPAIDPDFNVGYIKAVIEIADLIEKIDHISTSTDKLIVDLGSFNLGGTDIRSVTDLNNVSPSLSAGIPDIKSQLESKGATEATNLVSSFESSEAGQLKFPILNDSKNAFKLLLGQTADLFNYDMPELKFKLGYSQFYPIIYILGARLSFDLDAKIDLGFGFDTEGLKQFADSGKAADIFNGFFVNDFRTNPDGTIEDVPEVSVNAAIGGSGELNAAIASAGVEASIRANVDFNLHDDDGKVRVNEILKQIKEDPLCLFDTSGKVTAGLYAYYKFLGGREEIGLAETPPLISFDSKCDDKTGLKLADDVGGGVLRLNMGPNAGARTIGDIQDGNEIFTVSPDPNSGGVVNISAFGSRQKHNVSSKIVGNGGAGNDLINIQAGVQTPADLSGEIGDDQLYYRGTGSATLHGGDGNDQLVGGAASDELFGDSGDDNLKGGDKGDRLFGGDGSDRLSGEAGDDKLLAGSGDDYLAGGAGADTLDGGEGIDAVSYISSGEAVSVDIAGGKSSGADAAGDVLLSIEKLTGSEFGDTLSGSTQNDIIDGGGGNDAINGGDGNDTLTPGLGDDTIDGGTGTDLLVLDYSALPTRAVAWRDIDPTDPASWDVFVGNAYGVGTPLTIDIGKSTAHYDVALSADGTTVAWTDEEGVWVKKVGNSSPPFRINTDNNPNFYGSSLSADGSKVAWIDYRGQEADLFVANTDGTGITKITRFELVQVTVKFPSQAMGRK
jgi:Ca2+-binding RTX toxin-like protein